MPLPVATYAPRFRLPEIIERGQAVTLSCPVYREGALVAPTEAGSTVRILRKAGTEYLPASAIAVSSSVATYALPAVSTSEPCEEGWRIEWALVMPDGLTHTFRNSLALVLRRLYPVISDQDLKVLHPDLDTLLTSTQANWQSAIEEAWYALQWRLLQNARRPWLVIEPGALREYHVRKTLEAVFRDAATSADSTGRWQALADHYRQSAEQAWGQIRMEEDTSEAASQVSRPPARATTFLCPLDRPSWR